jgi:hypothetical protein
VATLRNDPTFRKLIEQKDLKEIDGNIVEKLEMPRELYERMEAQAHFSNHKPSELTEEMGKALVELVVAQTLLVYERLNKFYK